jgi:hypothetical protein
VRDRATNRPVAGVTIKSWTMAPHPRVGDQFLVQTTTDAVGRFTLVGMPKGQGNTILAIPDDTQPYAALRCPVPDPPGFAPVAVEIGLVRGVWVEGTVTDRRTGKPVPLAEVEYRPDVFTNRTTLTVPGLSDNYELKERFFPALSGPDGKFRVLSLPGKGYLTARVNANQFLTALDRVGEGGSALDDLPTLPYTVSARNVNAVYAIDLPPGAGPFRRPVTLDSGLRFVAAVVGPGGEPVPGAMSFGRSAWASWRPETQPGRHQIDAYNPGRPRTVLFRQAGKNLVGDLEVPKGFAADTLTLTLRPGVTLTGRVVDAGGRPKPGVSVSLSFKRKREDAWCSYTAKDESPATDASGRLRFAGLVPGLEYVVVLNGVHDRRFTADAPAGGNKDLGDIRMKPKEE